MEQFQVVVSPEQFKTFRFPTKSAKLLDEHDIAIEYLENLENPMYQKYFQLASLIDPIIDGCYHIPIQKWYFAVSFLIMLFLKKKIEVFRRKLIGKVEQNERALRKSRMERGVTLPLMHLP